VYSNEFSDEEFHWFDFDFNWTFLVLTDGIQHVPHGPYWKITFHFQWQKWLLGVLCAYQTVCYDS
jgi:hypothetical protein